MTKKAKRKENAIPVIDNGLKTFIERSPGLAGRYTKEVNAYLEERYGYTYSEAHLWRMINNKVVLNSKSVKVKEALRHLSEELVPA